MFGAVVYILVRSDWEPTEDTMVMTRQSQGSQALSIHCVTVCFTQWDHNLQTSCLIEENMKQPIGAKNSFRNCLLW